MKIVLVVLGIQWIWFQPFAVPSGSMEPTIHGDEHFFVGDRVAVNKHRYGIRVPFTNKLIYRGADPQRWDIVVFNNPDKNAKHGILVKRLVGLPGERIHIRGGKVYVNGKALELPADMPPVQYTSGDMTDPEEVKRKLDRMNLSPADRRAYEAEIMRVSVANSGLAQFKYGVLLEDEYSVVPPDHYLMLGDNSANSGDGRVFGWVPRENLIGPVFCIWWPFSHGRDFTGFTKTWWGKPLLYGIPALFILYEILSASFVRSWRVSHAGPGELFQKGDHVVVNQAAFGVRLPLLGARVTQGRPPRRNELVFYVAPGPDGSEQLCMGHVFGFPGDSVTADAGGDGRGSGASVVPAGHYFIRQSSAGRETAKPACVAHGDLAGSVMAVWWPVSRARSFAAPDDGDGGRAS
ncbi:MAG: signal peptidase I [Candidatus Hydrogenedentes bacterium]|nr:signal peptidase I [Candidatus Hydrogenedentota bacterium]